jgi:hypothetical protein
MIHSIKAPAVLRAFHAMNAQELSPARDFLRDELQKTLDVLVTAPADQVPQLQGRARVLRDILETVAKAADVLHNHG